MQLITGLGLVGAVTQNGSVAEAKYLASLLTDGYTVNKIDLTVASLELIGIHVCFDGTAELLDRHQVQELDVISIQRGCLSARRRLGNSGQTVPSHALRISAASCLGIKNALLYTSFIEPFAGLIPYNFGHRLFLLLEI
jgi:hypothetical protein